MLSIARRNGAKLLAAAAAGAMVLSPAFATGTPAKKRSPAISLSLEPIAVFTPANADPKLAAALAGKPLPLTGFGFTPAPAKDRPSQVRVAIRAQGATPVETQVAAAAAPTTAVNALAPTTYNLGVAVGWRRFAVSGDVAKVSEANPALGGRESAIVGVSYSLSNKLSTRVAVGADRATGDSLPALRQGDKVSLDVGGSYSLSRRVALTGGVRYNRERDASPLRDDRRDSQAVYVGTAFKF
ncbi:MAG TPA: porin [Sphingomicrobium sp.]|nr:porin [Sphingomicrobium sp.]